MGAAYSRFFEHLSLSFCLSRLASATELGCFVLVSPLA